MTGKASFDQNYNWQDAIKTGGTGIASDLTAQSRAALEAATDNNSQHWTTRGYTCSHCGQWVVDNGWDHTCMGGTRFVTVTQYPRDVRLSAPDRSGWVWSLVFAAALWPVVVFVAWRGKRGAR